jgi:hypothetical protein
MDQYVLASHTPGCRPSMRQPSEPVAYMDLVLARLLITFLTSCLC